MNTFSQDHVSYGVLVARVFLGVLFAFQGFDAIFNVKISNVIGAYEDSFSGKGISRPLVAVGSWFTSIVELVGGILLITGYQYYPTLCMLGFNLVFVSIAFSILEPMWDMKFFFPRMALILLLL